MKTFLDSGVLLTGWKGKDREEAIAVMEDETREFVSSQLVRLELNPKAAFHKQSVELEFYLEHFERVRKEEPLSEALGEEAFKLASRYGLAAADALNLAAAIRLGAQEFVTTEAPGKPMFRVREVKVTSLQRPNPPVT